MIWNNFISPKIVCANGQENMKMITEQPEAKYNKWFDHDTNYYYYTKFGISFDFIVCNACCLFILHPNIRFVLGLTMYK